MEDKQEAPTRKNTRNAAGLSPVGCFAAMPQRRRYIYRPAGTREALPGTICGTKSRW